MRSDRRRVSVNAPSPQAPDSRINSRRRGFLLAIGAGGAGAAALAARSLSGVAPQSEADEATDAKGYRETEHVRRYYRTTKI